MLVPVLLALAALTTASLGERVHAYMHESSAWVPARGMMLGRAPGPLPGDPEDPAEAAGLRDDFSVEHGPVALCHWDDVYARTVPAIAHLRAIARAHRWAPGTRARLRLDPTQPTECRPAYGWAEFVRLDLTAHILLILVFAGGALFVSLAPRE